MSATATVTGLKFTTRLSAFRDGLRPAIDVATKGSLKECSDANRLSIEAKDAEVIVNANGGRLAISVILSNLTHNNLDYSCDGEGKVTVNATDLQRTLDSFPGTERVVVSYNGKEFVVATENGGEEQALPVAKENIEIPSLASKFDKDVKVNRNIFLEGIKETFWAVGFEDHKEHWLHWRLVVESGRAEFAAGTGARFSIWESKGRNAAKCDAATTFYIPKDQTPAIQSALSFVGKDTVDEDIVVIKQAARQGDTVDQIVFEVPEFRLILVGFDSSMKWPNVDKMIKEDKPYSIVTKISDWEFATKGLLATFNEDVKKDHDTHESDLEPKLDKNYILLTTNTGMRAQRKVPFLRIEKQGDQKDSIVFHCSTVYVGEIYSKCPKGDEVWISYTNDVNKPVFVIGPETDNAATGTKSRYTRFFASMKP